MSNSTEFAVHIKGRCALNPPPLLSAKFESANLLAQVWCHGASDVILRVGQAAAKLGGTLGADVQKC